MRTKNSLKNIISNYFNLIIVDILKFVSRTIFIKTLGETYLGVNGLLSNVLGLLSLAELGIDSAISFSLYKPLANKDENKILALMHFYKKAYHIIAGVIAGLGLVLLPLLPHIIKDTSGIKNLNFIYLFYLFNMVISYLFAYKRTLINADQKKYKIVPIITICNVLTTVFQIIVLITTKNFLIYLGIQSLFNVLENLLVNRYINKKYQYLKSVGQASKLDKKELNNIKKNVKALMFHKIGGYALNSTDNIVISKFIGLNIVGLYSNYLMLVYMIDAVIGTFIRNTTASFGNLMATSDKDKKQRVFNEMNFICFVLYGISMICFINLFNPFIKVWIGEKYLLPDLCVYLISVNFYLLGMAAILDIVKAVSGIYNEDKFVPIIQCFVNLIVSIYLGKKIGLSGVLIGTLLSIIVSLIMKPIIVYRKMFDKSYLYYYRNYFYNAVTIILATLLSIIICNFVDVPNEILKVAFNLLVSITIPSIIILVLNYKKQPFNDAANRIKNLFKRGS